MDNIERLQSYEMDEWCRQFMIDNNTDYVTAYNAYKHELKAKRYEQERNARNPDAERQIFIRNYQSETGATRQQAINHVDRHMPGLKNYGTTIHWVAAHIENPQHDNDDFAMKSFRQFFKDNPDHAKKCAGEWIAEIANHVATHRVTSGENKFLSQKLSEATKEVMRTNPDIQEMYESGRASESAILTIFHFRFSNGTPYDIAQHHGGIV